MSGWNGVLTCWSAQPSRPMIRRPTLLSSSASTRTLAPQPRLLMKLKFLTICLAYLGRAFRRLSLQVSNSYRTVLPVGPNGPRPIWLVEF